jgi:hypothetical protein
VSATVWPPHAHIKIEKGDVVMVEGKFSRNKGTDANGDEVVYNNLSVARLSVLGHADEGKKIEVDNPVADDDDLPF